MHIVRRMLALASAGALALTMAACSSSDPLGAPTGAGSTPAGDSIVIGSQAYYSNEIIAEIYAQALEAKGFTVTRQFSIGQRDAYMPALENGEIQLFPEYSGNLLQFFDPDATATSSADVYTALQSALPTGLSALTPAPATDQDSYTVTAQFAKDHNLTTIEDLANVDVPLILGGPAELEQRPYGPQGLKSTYGVDVTFQATGDTTVQDLTAGTVNVANVFTADPRIKTENLVTLTDTKSLFLASNVVPIVASDLAGSVAPVLDPVNAALTSDELVALNVESTTDQRSSADIARDWLTKHALL